MQFDLAIPETGGNGDPERARATTEIDDDGRGARRATPNRLRNEVLGSAPRHEHTWPDGYLEPAELRPADHLLQRQPGNASGDQGAELRRGVGRGDQQGSFVLGEDAAGGS
jgi:hypothetical protein